MKCSSCFKIRAIKRYVQLVCELINLFVCLYMSDPSMSAHGERICKCSCLCMCVCVCVCVCVSICLSVSARQYKPVTRSETNVSGKTSFSGHVANVVFLCPCRRTGAVNSVTLYSLVVTVHAVCVCCVPRAVTVHTHGV